MTSTQTTLVIAPITAIKSLVDLMAEHDLTPLHFQVDAKKVGDTRPDFSLWMQTRTDFELFCKALGAKAKENYPQPGQRSWHANHDTEDRRLLVQVVSFAHHDDWVSRQEESA